MTIREFPAKVGDVVKLAADFVDIQRGVVVAVERLGFQIEGRNVWFGWHEFVEVIESTKSIDPLLRDRP